MASEIRQLHSVSPLTGEGQLQSLWHSVQLRARLLSGFACVSAWEKGSFPSFIFPLPRFAQEGELLQYFRNSSG